MLKSTREDFQVRKALHNYQCNGFAGQKTTECQGVIVKGTDYVVKVKLRSAPRQIPRLFNDVSRHCANCAMALIPQIRVAK